VRWEKKSGGGNSRVRVSPELVQVSSASTRWQQSFDAPITDVFQVQGQIAGEVAKALDVALGVRERETLAEKPTQNLQAYDAFLKGEALSDGLSENSPVLNRRAVAYYEQAVALDSNFLLAWVQLSRAHSRLYFAGVPSPIEADAARGAAERALGLAPERAEGHLALGFYYYQVTKDQTKALAEFQQGLQIAPTSVGLLYGAAGAERALGKSEEALAHLQEALKVDPRSVTAAFRYAQTLMYLRRHDDAIAAADRGLALAPTNLDLLEIKAMTRVAQGDLVGARAIVRDVPVAVDPSNFVAYLGSFFELYWLLDEGQQVLLLRQSPAPFDNDRAQWGIVLSELYWMRGDTAKARVMADSGRIALEDQLRASPQDAQLHVFHGLMLAYLGRVDEAIQEGERTVAQNPIAKDVYFNGYLTHQLARIYIVAGKRDKAIDQIEVLLRTPYYLTPAWLRIDPHFAPLRDMPRFQRVAGG
jgi:serine/threonine-protein kinase